MTTAARAPVPWRTLSILVFVELALYLLSSGPLAYGYMSDELYYFDCADRLAWGYVDHAPLSLVLLRGVRAALGDSLLAIHLLPALAACATIVLVALLARELGGGGIAQGLAGLAALIAPVYLGVAGFYSMNAFEPALWAGAALILAHILNGGDRRLWLALGFVLGVGLLNKISMLWFGLGLVVGLALTPERRWLVTPWPYLAAALSFALFAPHVVWQVQHGLPTLEFMRNAAEQKMVSKSPLGFAAEQLLMMNPLAVPFWLAGLVYYFASPAGVRHRLLGWIWITVFLLLAASGSARTYYLGPAYTALLPAGGVALERLARGRGWRWLPVTAAVVFVVSGAATAPMAIPLLPPARYVNYEKAIGLSPPVEEQGGTGLLPLHFALRFGWEELIEAVDAAHATLSEEERTGVAVFGSWFGDTGAVNFFGRDAGLPPAISGHNNYWLWGPQELSGDVMIVIAPSDSRLVELFERVDRVSGVGCRYCMPDMSQLSVYVCRGLRQPLSEVWPRLKHYR
jgi:4-amino-4-deoxy-L-arabinose transferase-like glycosyltransferase